MSGDHAVETSTGCGAAQTSKWQHGVRNILVVILSKGVGLWEITEAWHDCRPSFSEGILKANLNTLEGRL